MSMDEQTTSGETAPAHDPYAPPSSVMTPPAAGDDGLPLFKVRGVGIATFCGSVLAGGILMAMNFHRMGQPERVWPTLGLSCLGLLISLGLGFVLPEGFPNFLVTLPVLWAMVTLAERYQGEAIKRRTDAGLPMRSNWLAFGISLLVILPVLAVIFVLAMLFA